MRRRPRLKSLCFEQVTLMYKSTLSHWFLFGLCFQNLLRLSRSYRYKLNVLFVLFPCYVLLTRHLDSDLWIKNASRFTEKCNRVNRLLLTVILIIWVSVWFPLRNELEISLWWYSYVHGRSKSLVRCFTHS